MADGGRIVVVAGHSGREGGAEAHVLSSVDALAAVGYDVTLVAGSPHYVEGWGFEAFRETDVRVISGLRSARAERRVVDELLALVETVDAQVAHFHDAFDPVLPLSARGRCAVAWSMHNFAGCTSGYKYFRRPGDECGRPHGPGCLGHLLLHGCAHAKDPRPIPGMYRRTSARLAALRSMDVALAHSRFIAAHLRTNRVERVRLAPLFLPRPARPAAVPAETRLLFAGRATPAKGLEVLVRAVAGLDLRLDVCGAGWGLPRARRLASTLGLDDRVAFHGRVAPADMTKHYARATIVVVPSLWPEPFGLVGLEAMAHGRPVVASATGGIPEWLVDDETGLLVPPGDPSTLAEAISTLASDRARAEEMGRRGATRVRECFSRETYLQAIHSAYEEARSHWERSAGAA